MFQLRQVGFKSIIEIDSLDLPEGQIISLIGPSGSGKTTLLRMLNRLNDYHYLPAKTNRPTNHSHENLADNKGIFYHKKELKSINPMDLRRQVVMLSQTPVLFEGNLQQNLQIGLNFSNKPEATQAQLKEVLETVQLSKALTDNPRNFSGGEKQRVALARVLLLNPPAYLLDEPSASLDNETKRQVLTSLIKRVRQDGRSLIMVTHSTNLAHDYSDKVIYIKQGRVEEVVNRD